MFQYFDKLLIRTYFQYLKWNEKDIPKYKSILIISLFQSFNLVFIFFLIMGLIVGNRWKFPTYWMAVVMISVLCVNLLRLKVLGFEKLVKRYNSPSIRKVKVHPVIYFGLSLGCLFLLKFIGLFPQIN